MGGIGSGNRWRFGTKATCEGSKRIDLAFMKRRGLLIPGRSGSLSWSIGGEPNGNIQYWMQLNSLILTYNYRQQGDKEWVKVHEAVPFAFTDQKLGGVRRWFRCLSCDRRCSILYGGTHFRCRKCSNLTYATQNESPMYRGLTKAQKIRERLGGSLCIDDPFPAKPKGMHQNTYRRLKVKGYLVEKQVNQLSTVFLERLKGLI